MIIQFGSCQPPTATEVRYKPGLVTRRGKDTFREEAKLCSRNRVESKGVLEQSVCESNDVKRAQNTLVLLLS
jgi:hypothetical protein